MTVIISVAQQKGGAGKTTLSTNVTVCLSNLGKRVALIDLDPQKSATMWYGLRQDYIGHNTIDLLLHDYDLDAVLEQNCGRYDVIIIDTPPYTKESAKKLIDRSDFVMIPTQLSPMDIWATQPILDLTRDSDTAHFMVLNRVPHASKVSTKLHESLIECELPIAKTPIGNRNSYVASFLNGSGVTESEQNSKAAFEIKELTLELLQKTTNTKKDFVASSFV